MSSCNELNAGISGSSIWPYSTSFNEITYSADGYALRRWELSAMNGIARAYSTQSMRLCSSSSTCTIQYMLQDDTTAALKLTA